MSTSTQLPIPQYRRAHHAHVFARCMHEQECNGFSYPLSWLDLSRLEDRFLLLFLPQTAQSVPCIARDEQPCFPHRDYQTDSSSMRPSEPCRSTLPLIVPLGPAVPKNAQRSFLLLVACFHTSVGSHVPIVLFRGIGPSCYVVCRMSYAKRRIGHTMAVCCCLIDCSFVPDWYSAFYGIPKLASDSHPTAYR